MAAMGQGLLKQATLFFEALQSFQRILSEDEALEEPIPISFLKALTFAIDCADGILSEGMPAADNLRDEIEEGFQQHRASALEKMGVQPDIILSAKLDGDDVAIPVGDGHVLLNPRVWKEYREQERPIIMTFQGKEYLACDDGWPVEGSSYDECIEDCQKIFLWLYDRSRFDWDS